MRKFLDQKFWSQETKLGYLGALLAKGLPKIFPHMTFWIVLRVM